MADKKTIKSAPKAVVPKLDKSDLLTGAGFTKLEIDILKVVLADGQKYSVDQAKQAIKKFKEAI